MSSTAGRSLTLVLAVLAALAAGACSEPVHLAPPLPHDGAGDAFQGVACSAVRPQTEPDLMGWDPGSRANLHKLRQGGVVAVRYVSQGCNVELEVLSNCIGKGTYAFSYYPESRSKTLKSARELFAEVPVSAAQLSGKLKGSRVLKTDYELIGTASLPAGATYRRAQLSGPAAECARATHVVSTLYLGGFAMVAGEESKLTAKGKVFGVSAGDTEGASVDHIDSAGDAKACEEAKKTRKETEGCQVPLRIGLLALEDAAPAKGPACPEGMALVPGGTFTMLERGDKVTVAGFCMDLTEVTAGSYAACVGAGRCGAEHLAEYSLDGSAFTPSRACNYGIAGREDHPINCVDWTQADAFCRALEKRLPTEEEWEWAARGGARGATYPWGNDAPGKQLCWDGEGSELGKGARQTTCPVGSHRDGDSPLGIHDLAGNVWEWTSNKPTREARIYRGGGWSSGAPPGLRAADGGYGQPSFRNDFVGFRCARDDH